MRHADPDKGLTKSQVESLRESNRFRVVAPFLRRGRDAFLYGKIGRITYPDDNDTPYTFDQAVDVLGIFCSARAPYGGPVPEEVEPYALEVVTYVYGMKMTVPRRFTLRDLYPGKFRPRGGEEDDGYGEGV